MFVYPDAVAMVAVIGAAVGMAVLSRGRARPHLLAAILVAVVAAVLVRWYLA